MKSTNSSKSQSAKKKKAGKKKTARDAMLTMQNRETAFLKKIEDSTKHSAANEGD